MAGWGIQLHGLGSALKALDGIQMRLDDNAVYVVGTNVEYAIFQEFGTSRQEGTPHLFPAARAVQRDAQRIAGDANTVEEAVKRLAFAVERGAKERAPVDTGNLKASYRTERIK